MQPQRILIMGAAGRDFHNFNVYFRDNEQYEVVAFTATQIPNIEGRVYPASLSGNQYPEGIPIHPEEELEVLIRDKHIDQVVFAYSDVSHEYVMHIASRVLASGADYRLMGTASTQIPSKKPVISICAARTGSGKSQTTRYVADKLTSMGLRVAVIRHPMPYGDLERQAVQRFTKLEDLDLHKCTIEEREEYEPHISRGINVYSGIDYAKILELAEMDADIILWDGGNNDLSFYKSDLHIVVVDPHRPGHEIAYHPGEANVIAANVIVVNKVDTADPEGVKQVLENVSVLNPTAQIIEASSPISVDNPEEIRGASVLVVEELTHGEMAYGAGWVAANQYKAGKIIDPRPFAVGSIKKVYENFPTTGDVLPAMGYDDEQMMELEQTINAATADLVLIGTPIDLGKLLNLNKPSTRVTYELEVNGQPSLEDIIETLFKDALR
jgi:predicted GTPase